MAKRDTGKLSTDATNVPEREGASAQEQTWTAVPRLLGSSEKHAFFLVLAGPQFGDIFPLAPGRELVVGRRDDCDVQIRDDGVSRRHATIEARARS
jgi:type III secretion system (T3SS) inner membrane Yop/YscD-like protein